MKGNFAQAKSDWAKALEIDPNNANARNNLEALRQLGR
jgi:Flp pilus assembly protein TadD